MKIYISGAHSTGKTTLARWISNEYNLPLVTEVARSVLAELELSLSTLRVDLDKTSEFQREILKRQIVAEDNAGTEFVSDRALDHLAYTASHTLILKELVKDTEKYISRLQCKDSIVFFVRPHKELLADDGVREMPKWDDVVRIDGMIKFVLEMFDINYIPINTLSMSERVRTIKAFMDKTRNVGGSL